MNEFLYDINSGLIAAFQLISMVIAIEVGYRMGLGRRDSTSEAVVSEANAIGTAYLLAQARK